MSSFKRRRRLHLPPFLPKAESVAPDRKDPRVSGRTCFVPSTAKPSSVTSPSDTPVASTNLKRDSGNTKDSLCNWVQLPDVNSCSFFVDVGRPTPAKTAPYCIALSTAFSIDPLISGEYPSSNPSSSWSDERSASTYVKISSWRGWAVAKVRTVSFAENCTSR